MIDVFFAGPNKQASLYSERPCVLESDASATLPVLALNWAVKLLD